MKINMDLTSRNFAVGTFSDLYGSRCSIQESSLATDDAIWLGVSEDFNGVKCTRMHLSREMAEELAKLLQTFAETGSLYHA